MHRLAFNEYSRAFQRHRILSQKMPKTFSDIYESFKCLRNRYLQVAVLICGVRVTKDIPPCFKCLHGCDWNKR